MSFSSSTEIFAIRKLILLETLLVHVKACENSVNSWKWKFLMEIFNTGTFYFFFLFFFLYSTSSLALTRCFRHVLISKVKKQANNNKKHSKRSFPHLVTFSWCALLTSFLCNSAKLVRNRCSWEKVLDYPRLESKLELDNFLHFM